jgi:hypothetical protein
MNQTFQNSAQVLSIGIFSTPMIIGLASSLPSAMTSGLEADGVAAATARYVAHLPPVSILFAAFLGYNPIQHPVGAHALAMLTPQHRSLLIGRSFFPHLISPPFRSGLHEAFAFAIIACLVAAAASLMRGGRYYDVEESRSEAHGGRARRPGNGLDALQPECKFVGNDVPQVLRAGCLSATMRMHVPLRLPAAARFRRAPALATFLHSFCSGRLPKRSSSCRSLPHGPQLVAGAGSKMWGGLRVGPAVRSMAWLRTIAQLIALHASSKRSSTGQE